MVQNRIISTKRLGYNVICEDIGGTKKLVVKIDGDTIKSSADGVLSVDLEGLGVKVVSDDAGNVISIGGDTGAYLDEHKIKEIVGSMVASATDGIDYDGVTEALTAHLASLGVTDTDTVDLTYTNTDGTGALTANVKLSPVPDNAIDIDVASGGLYVPPTVIPATTNETNLNIDDGVLDVSINGVNKALELVEILDCDDIVLGYMFKTQ